ncbi:hypothetical protein CYLTODRAFT_420298 [Cylindrobasidium torrendii FP15055 ss-10]|uniref:F-box domain-containing protein n=1 Tax=Cylindrobasidium torrendii FP15055 ss-10 TaxID=1314674 RepID=A0A0D7BHD0_9AGAR|nr:hypothetical protein CYLTODRAFT_420298 [Cylindrobasidium torrendii FP15055 ss-10]
MVGLNDVPDDVLRTILLLVKSDRIISTVSSKPQFPVPWNTDTPLQFSRINRKFRHAALTTPWLWNHIIVTFRSGAKGKPIDTDEYIKRQSQRVDHFLRHSGMVAPHLFLIHAPQARPPRVGHEIKLSALANATLEKLRAIDRWESIVFGSRSSWNLWAPGSVIPSTPFLHTVSFYKGNSMISTVTPKSAERREQFLSLDPRKNPMHPMSRKVVLDPMELDLSINLNELPELIEGIGPQIRELVIHPILRGSLSSPGGPHRWRQITSFTISLQTPSHAGVLVLIARFFEFHCLQHLTLYWDSNRGAGGIVPVDLNTLVSFVKQTTTLERITLDGLAVVPAGFILLLEVAAGLKTLVLHEPTANMVTGYYPVSKRLLERLSTDTFFLPRLAMFDATLNTDFNTGATYDAVEAMMAARGLKPPPGATIREA